MVGENDYLPEYKIIQENPVEPGTAGGCDGTSTSGSVAGGGGKVRFENPFGISSEDVISSVDKVCVRAFEIVFNACCTKTLRRT